MILQVANLTVPKLQDWGLLMGKAAYWRMIYFEDFSLVAFKKPAGVQGGGVQGEGVTGEP